MLRGSARRKKHSAFNHLGAAPSSGGGPWQGNGRETPQKLRVFNSLGTNPGLMIEAMAGKPAGKTPPSKEAADGSGCAMRVVVHSAAIESLPRRRPGTTAGAGLVLDKIRGEIPAARTDMGRCEEDSPNDAPEG